MMHFSGADEFLSDAEGSLQVAAGRAIDADA